MNPYQNQGYGGGHGWTGGAWDPSRHGYNQQNWQQQPPPPQQPHFPPPPQYNPLPYNNGPAPQLFCCENCQRVAPAAQQTVHAYTTRLAFFILHITHPTNASYAIPRTQQLHRPGHFNQVAIARAIPTVGANGGNVNAQQHGGNQQLQAPTGPAIGVNTNNTAVNGSQINFQSGINQHHGGGVAQQAQHNGPPNNPASQGPQGPIMYAGSSYSIDLSYSIPLPQFYPPNFQLNVKFRLERYRLDHPQQPFQYGNPSPYGHGMYQAAFNTPYQSNSLSVHPSTNSPRPRENMELIWYYWPVQLEVPLWARGQNTATSAPDIAAQLVQEGMQIINGERWAFIEDMQDREGLWHKRRSYKVLECPVHGMLWKVTVFVRRGY